MAVRHARLVAHAAGEPAQPQAEPRGVDVGGHGARDRRLQLAHALLRATDGPNGPRDLMVLRAHFQEGLNPAEIAAMGVGLSAKGVETLLRRARERIETELAGPVLRSG